MDGSVLVGVLLLETVDVVRVGAIRAGVEAEAGMARADHIWARSAPL